MFSKVPHDFPTITPLLNAHEQKVLFSIDNKGSFKLLIIALEHILGLKFENNGSKIIKT